MRWPCKPVFRNETRQSSGWELKEAEQGLVLWETQRGTLFRPIVPNQYSRVAQARLLFDLVFVVRQPTLCGAFHPLGEV